MKFNWGTGIAIFFTIFVVTLVSTVIKTTQHDHSLVMEKYYEGDLKYQQQFDKIANRLALGEDIKINVHPQEEEISLEFPKTQEKVIGSVLFFKPDNKSKDKILPIALEHNNVFTTSSSGLTPGRWKIKVDWSDGKKSYYQELNLNL